MVLLIFWIDSSLLWNGMFSSIPSLHPLDVSSNPPPPTPYLVKVKKKKKSLEVAKCPPGEKNTQNCPD